MGFIVICCGGGGIPVVMKGRAFNGIDAVLEKNLASECLADEVGVDIFCYGHGCGWGDAEFRDRSAVAA